MDAGLVERLLGGDRRWAGRCVLVLTADASVRAAGPDSMMSGGLKSYAPRQASGRVEADAVCLMKEWQAIAVLEQHVHRDGTGTEHIRQTLLIADLSQVAAIEFPHAAPLRALGLSAPPLDDDGEYRPGALVG
jgi:hypothetical protein